MDYKIKRFTSCLDSDYTASDEETYTNFDKAKAELEQEAKDYATQHNFTKIYLARDKMTASVDYRLDGKRYQTAWCLYKDEQ